MPSNAKNPKWEKLRYKTVVVSVDEQGNPTKTILKRRSLAWIPALIVLAIFVGCWFFIPTNVKFKPENIGTILSELFKPSPWSLKTNEGWWNYLWGTACVKIWETVEMVFIATVVGTVTAVPFYLLASHNVCRNRPVNMVLRVIINIIRTIPTFVLAIVGAIFFGYSNTAGIFAMSVFTFGIIFKLMYEFIETQDMNPFEVCVSNGANRLEAYWNGLHPSVYPMFLSNFIYTFEINIRASVILGFVGAGGVGQLLSDATAQTNWDKVGAILVPLFVVVFVLQLLSNYLRRRIG